MELITSAEELFENGDFKKAAMMAKKAMDKLMKDKKYTDAIRVLEIRVNAMCGLNDYEKALALLEKEVLVDFRNKGETHCEVLVASLLSNVNLSKGNIEEAFAKADAAKELATNKRDKVGEAVALRALVKVKLHKEQVDEAIDLSQRVSHIMKDLKDPEAQGFQLHFIAELHLWAGQYQECISSVKKAVPLFRKVGNKDGEANALRVGAEASWQSGVLRQARWQAGTNECALSMALAASELYKAVGNAEGQITMGMMTAKLLFELEEFEEAYECAVELKKRMSANTRKALLIDATKISIDALTSRYRARKSTATRKSYKEWLQAAVDAAYDLVSLTLVAPKADQAEANQILANTLVMKGTELADDSLQLAVQIAEKNLKLAADLQDRSLEASTYILLSEVKFANGDINAAIEAMYKADEIYKDLTDIIGQSKTESLRVKFRLSNQWHKVKVRTADGAMRKADDVEKEFIPKIASEFYLIKGVTPYVHFDNMTARAAVNIG